MRRINIRELLLLVTISALGTAWWLSALRLQHQVEGLAERLAHIDRLHRNLISMERRLHSCEIESEVFAELLDAHGETVDVFLDAQLREYKTRLKIVEIKAEINAAANENLSPQANRRLSKIAQAKFNACTELLAKLEADTEVDHQQKLRLEKHIKFFENEMALAD